MEQMSILDARLYLDRARVDLLAAKSNIQQGFHGVAISRAYYAMFYAASALLASKGLSRSKHSGVHSAFGEQFVKAGLIEPEYARMLINAFDSRLDADYEADFTAGREVAETVLDDAKKFVARIERYLQEIGLI
ncbi:MAG: HEPN domain-containing protein [Chloroflexi bacterium]|nr:HEPN domain-containing protein [Chloroflexota bacterium]